MRTLDPTYLLLRLLLMFILTTLSACQSSYLNRSLTQEDKINNPSVFSTDIKYVRANNLTFAYLEEGEGPLILLMHGYPETARTWQKVQHRLASAGYRVVAPFMRGYPPTDYAPDYSIPSLGRDVLALIDALGSEQAVVIGHDWGAAAAYSAQAQDPSKLTALVALSFPVPGVVLTHPQFIFRAPLFFYYQFPWAEHMVTSNNFKHIENIYAEWSPGYSLPANMRREIKATLRVPRATANVLAYYKDIVGFTDIGAIYDSLSHEITTPSLVIAGADDAIVSLSLYDSARSNFKGPYQFLKLDNVGHFPQLESPDAVSNAILAFLSKQSTHGSKDRIQRNSK